MRPTQRSPMDELCLVAEHAGWWVELATEPACSKDQPPRLAQLLIRNRTDPNQVRYIHLRAGPDAVNVAARRLARNLLEAA